MASTDATPFPIKNQAYRVTFPILDADGDLVTAAGALDSEVSKDGGAFTDCTNEATEIATSSGMYYLDLTATEMNADTVAIIVKSTGGKTTPIVLYPVQLTVPMLGVNVEQWNNTAVPTENSAGYPIVTIKDGTGTGEIDTASGRVAITEAQIDQIVDEVWDELKSGHTTADSFGDYLDDEITSRAAPADIPSAAAIADAVLDEDMTAHQTQGTLGQAIGDPAADSDTIWGLINTNLNATVSSRAATGDAMALTAAAVDAIWDEDVDTSHQTAGTAGKKLDDAGGAADPWATALPGAYGAGTAGKIVGDNLNATVSSRSSHSAADIWAVATRELTAFSSSFKTGYALSSAGVQAIWDALTSALTTAGSIGKLLVDNVNASISAIKSKTDQLTFTNANKVDSSLQAAGDIVAAVANKIADHVLRRTYANVRASSDGDTASFRSLMGAVAKLVNKWTLSGGTLTVYHEDDATSIGTQAATTNASAEPITTLDTS